MNDSIKDHPDCASFCYALLKPDVVLRGIVREVLNVLTEFGFAVIDFRIGRMSDELFNRMYESSFYWELDYWFHNRGAYSYGPIIGLVLRHEHPGQSFEMGAQPALNSFKGPAIPDSRDLSSIRAKCGTANRVFNILHIPESTEAAIAEAGLWFGEPRIRGWIEHSAPSSEMNRAEAIAGTVIDADVRKHGYTADNHLNGDAVFYRVKTRLLHAIAASITSSQGKTVLSRLNELYIHAVEEILEMGGCGYAKKMILSLSAIEEQLLLEAQNSVLSSVAPNATAPEVQQVFEVILCLLRKQKPKQPMSEFFWHLIAKWNVYVSDFERYLITTAFLYPAFIHTATIPPTGCGTPRLRLRSK